mgnify:CR=1 FL=1
MADLTSDNQETSGKAVREKLAGLLHDTLAPQLTISQQQLELLMASLEEDALSDNQQAMLIKSWRALQDGMLTLRDLIHAADTDAPLADEAFLPTVAQALARFTPLLTLDVSAPDETSALMQDKRLGVCLQELLTNALKYSPDRKVSVRLAEEDAMATLNVTSLGTGHVNPNGTGLVRLQKRLSAWGGRLQVTQSNNRFQVEATLPINKGPQK